MRMKLKKCPLWGLFYLAESLSGIANNVRQLGAVAAFNTFSTRANGGEITQIFVPRGMPTLRQTALLLAAACPVKFTHASIWRLAFATNGLNDPPMPNTQTPDASP